MRNFKLVLQQSGLAIACAMLLWSTPRTAAAMCLSGANEIPNCGFEIGEPPEQWQTVGASFSRVTSPVHGDDFAARIDSEDLFGLQRSFATSACVPVTPGQTYGAAARLMVSETESDLACSSTIAWYEDPACETFASLRTENQTIAPGNSWSLGTALATAPDNMSWAVASFGCENDASDPFTLVVDDAVLGQLGANGLEANQTLGFRDEECGIFVDDGLLEALHVLMNFDTMTCSVCRPSDLRLQLTAPNGERFRIEGRADTGQAVAWSPEWGDPTPDPPATPFWDYEETKTDLGSRNLEGTGFWEWCLMNTGGDGGNITPEVGYMIDVIPETGVFLGGFESRRPTFP